MEPSTTTSLTRSTMESMNAPRGPACPRLRAIAPSKMSRIEPTMNTSPAAIHQLLEDQHGGPDVQEEAGAQ